jgi:hypothetical protein
MVYLFYFDTGRPLRGWSSDLNGGARITRHMISRRAG